MTEPSRVVLAPDKFKGSLTASAVAEALMAGLRSVREDLVVSVVPVADGGDGTLAVALTAGYRRVTITVADALGRPHVTAFARRGEHAIIELAAVCGLQQLAGASLEPEHCTTLGLGEAVRAALDAGCTRITVGLGGSASTDGGAGLLCGLGARVLDADGRELRPTAAELTQATALDLRGLDPRLPQTDIEVAVDVDAPLLGPRGAATVFGPQKGADPDTVRRLEVAMRHWAPLLSQVRPQADPERLGSGAAGGTAFGALAIGARLVEGAETLLDLAGFDDALTGAGLVITGEGRLDHQTLMGKAPAVVARRAAHAAIPCVAVVGRRAAGLTDGVLREHGFSAVHELVAVDPAVATDPDLARSTLSTIGARIARLYLLAPQPLPTP